MAERGQEETIPTACELLAHDDASIDDGGRGRSPTATTGPHSRLLGIQQSTNIICDRTTSLKLEKSSLSLLMLFSQYSKAGRVDESSSVMIAGRDDGRTADAEHPRRQRRHIFGPPRDRSGMLMFSMPAMLGASAAEVEVR